MGNVAVKRDKHVDAYAEKKRLDDEARCAARKKEHGNGRRNMQWTEIYSRCVYATVRDGGCASGDHDLLVVEGIYVIHIKTQDVKTAPSMKQKKR